MLMLPLQWYTSAILSFTNDISYSLYFLNLKHLSLCAITCTYLEFTLYRFNMDCSTGTRPRTVFTEEQKTILLQAFDNGVNSINKNQAQTIKSLADQLECDESVIKVIFLNCASTCVYCIILIFRIGLGMNEQNENVLMTRKNTISHPKKSGCQIVTICSLLIFTNQMVCIVRYTCTYVHVINVMITSMTQAVGQSLS